MLITLLVFILILGLLVFVHELGHFWMAKRVGIRVHEFAFGFKPRIFAWKRGGTEYAINALPFGGYVRLEGESENTGKGSFMGSPPGKRALVLVAGVVMNLVLAWFLLTLAYGFGSYAWTPTFNQHPGLDSQSYPIVISVQPGSPAEQAGLQSRDVIQSINGQPTKDAETISKITHELKGQSVTIQYKRGVTEAETKATLRDNAAPGEGPLGVVPTTIGYAKAPWYQAPYFAVLEVGGEIKVGFLGFVGFIKQLVVQQKVSENVTGLVGIGAATGVVRRFGLGSLVQFIAFISTNLAVVNILPILPLDGGHLLFTGIEAIIKKPVKEVYRQSMALVGLVAIIALFFLVTYQDLVRFDILGRIKQIF